MINRKKIGVTLIEVTMAVVFLALAFIPIMGLFSSNLKITERDNANIMAMQLCQEKLDTALSMSFKALSAYAKDTPQVITNKVLKDQNITLDLNEFKWSKGNVVFHFEFTVSDRPGTFTIKPRNIETESANPENTPTSNNTYKFGATQKIPYKNLVHKYKMRVWWQGRGKTKADQTIKDYTLVTYKANLKSEL